MDTERVIIVFLIGFMSGAIVMMITIAPLLFKQACSIAQLHQESKMRIFRMSNDTTEV